MKSISNMYNVDLAKLLATLFPEEIPQLLHFMDEWSHDLVEKQESVREEWDVNPLISFDTWIAMAVEVSKVIKQQKGRLSKWPAAFANELFSGLLASYTRHVVMIYAMRSQCPPRLKRGIEMVFKL